MGALTVEPQEAPLPLGCVCCAPVPGGLRGLVYEDEKPHAVYSARPSRLASGPIYMTMTIGRWDDGSRSEDRKTVALSCRKSATGLEIRAAELDAASWPEMEGAGRPLSRSELEHDVDYAMIVRVARSIVQQDRRVATLADGPLPGHSQFRAD